jgi:hypothetical protein
LVNENYDVPLRRSMDKVLISHGDVEIENQARYLSKAKTMHSSRIS